MELQRLQQEHGLARLEALFARARVGLSEVAPDGRFLRVNDELCRMLGRSRAELLASAGVSSVTHPDDLPRTRAVLAKVLEGQGAASIEKRYMRSDGGVVWAESHLARLDDGPGPPASIVVVTVDLTARKRAEDALRASEERYRSLVCASPDAILVHRAGEVLYANPLALDLYGARSLDELSRHAVPPGGASIVRLDGRQVPVEVVESPVEYDGVQAVQAVVRDQTELLEARRLAEAAQRRAEHERLRLERVFEQAPFAVAVVSGPSHVVTSINALERSTIGSRSVVGLPLREAFPEESMQPLIAVFDEVFRSGEPRTLREYRLRWQREDGVREERYFDLILQPVREEEGPSEHTLVFSVDVTEGVRARKATDVAIREAEQAHALLETRVRQRTAELERTNEALSREVAERKRAEETRTELLSRLASAQEDEQRRLARDLHDQVGQTLTTLTLAVRAAGDAEPLSQQAAARLRDVQRAAERLSRDVHDLAIRLRPTALDDFGLHSAVGQLLLDVSTRASVEVDFQASWLESVRLSPDVETALYRVMQEAITNVARHASARHLSVVLERFDENVIAVVEDDGRGFDAEQPASGRLGLVGMRERVVLVGGTLEIESAPGHGTTVIARVPFRDAREGSLA
jgi:PAS domain S-box-containing protein